MTDKVLFRDVGFCSCDAAISCDNKRLAVSRPGDGCEVYEINSGFTSAIRVFKSASSDSQKYPLPVRFAHNGRAVLMGGYEDVVTLWDVSSGLLHQSIPVQSKHVAYDSSLS